MWFLKPLFSIYGGYQSAALEVGADEHGGEYVDPDENQNSLIVILHKRSGNEVERLKDRNKIKEKKRIKYKTNGKIQKITITIKQTKK